MLRKLIKKKKEEIEINSLIEQLEITGLRKMENYLGKGTDDTPFLL